MPISTSVLLAMQCITHATHDELSKGPYLQAPSDSAMTVMWETLAPMSSSVRFGRGDKLNQTATVAPPRTMKGVSTTSHTNVIWRTKTNVVDGVTNTVSGFKTNVVKESVTNLFYVYETRLTNLQPSTIYSYSVLVNGIGTPVRQFKTFGRSPSKITFIAYGDTRSFPKIHRSIAKQFGAYAPDFILHTGDLVMNGKNYGQWSREFFQPLADVIDTFPMLPAIGNHEEDGTNFLAYFHLPTTERWYAFDDGPVHVLALDYHFEKPRRRNSARFEAQLKFASNDLHSARAPWKIVFVHYPMFNVGGHGTDWGHEHYLPLFRETKVDLVLGGHSHLYERFRPVAPRADKSEWAMTHITTGGGGAELAKSHVHSSLAVNASTNHFVVFELTRDRLRGKAITASGHTLDQFEIRKSKGRPRDEYLAQLYPEETLQLSLDAGRSLTARLTAQPNPTNDSHVMFAVQPLKGTATGELEISVSPESAKYYTMEPIVVKTPPEKERIAWSTLRSTGAKRVRLADGKEFSPALIFQARAIVGDAQAMVYGQPSRLSGTASNEWVKLQKSLTNVVRSASASK